MNSLAQQFNAMPRAIRWLAVTVAFLVLFLAWDSFVQPLSAGLDEQADAIEADLASLRAGQELANEFKRVRPAVVALGPVEVPTGEAETAKALTDVKNNVLKNHDVDNQSFSLPLPGRLPKATLSSLAAGRSVQRLTCDLKFDATPEETIAIIAELESSPQIESIDNLKILKDANRKLKVQLAIDAWVMGGANSTRGATTEGATQ